MEVEVASASSCIATRVDVAQVDWGGDVISAGASDFSGLKAFGGDGLEGLGREGASALVGDGFLGTAVFAEDAPSLAVDLLGDALSVAAAFVGEARPGLAGNGGGTSILAFVGDVGFLDEG